MKALFIVAACLGLAFVFRLTEMLGSKKGSNSDESGLAHYKEYMD